MIACGFCISSNHIHLILRNRPNVVPQWSDDEVAIRWLRVFPGKRLKCKIKMVPSAVLGFVNSERSLAPVLIVSEHGIGLDWLYYAKLYWHYFSENMVVAGGTIHDTGASIGDAVGEHDWRLWNEPKEEIPILVDKAREIRDIIPNAIQTFYDDPSGTTKYVWDGTIDYLDRLTRTRKLAEDFWVITQSASPQRALEDLLLVQQDSAE